LLHGTVLEVLLLLLDVQEVFLVLLLLLHIGSLGLDLLLQLLFVGFNACLHLLFDHAVLLLSDKLLLFKLPLPLHLLL
jgi:hypothetical protein